MPLRDHYRPPVSKRSSWEGFHGMWPASIVQQILPSLPANFVAEPRVHLGAQMEIDVGTFEPDDGPAFGVSDSDGRAATAVWAPAEPTVAVETALPDLDEYAVHVYDLARGRRLVASVEIVSPANKDRPEHRNAFVGKCAALLRKGIAVSVVDLVTVRQFNLYAELMEFIGRADPTLTDPPAPVYATSCRWVRVEKRTLFQTWSHTLAVGAALPTLPLWLTADRAVPLALEESYERACRDLRIA